MNTEVTPVMSKVKGPLLAALGCAVLLAASVGAVGGDSTLARLTSVSALTEGRQVTVVIESSAPVPYTAAQPDPLTLVLDLRHAAAAGVSRAIARPVGPVADVTVEDAQSTDGVPVARVRMRLATPARPSIRSRRNAILVEFGGTSAAQPPVVQAPAAAAAGAPRAAALTLARVDVASTNQGARVTVVGNAPLPEAVVEPTRQDPPRLVLDFRGVVAATQTVSGPPVGPVERVRVAQNSRQPLIARVVIDLRQRVPYRVDSASGETSVTLDVPAGPAPAATDPAAARVPAPAPAATTSAPRTPPIPVIVPAAAPVPTPAAPAPAPAPAAKTPEPAPVPPAPVDVPQASPEPAAAKKVTKAKAVEAEAVAEVDEVTPEPKVEPKPEPKPAAKRAQAEPAKEQAPAPKAVQAPAAAPEAQRPSGDKVYSGNPVTFDFSGADLRAVLRTFSEISGLNVVIDPSISGTVDVSLREVPWDQALEIILRANKLGYAIENNVVRIATLKALQEEEAERRKLAEEQAMSGTLRVLTRSLSYAKADEMAELLKKSVMTQRGQVQVDRRTNTIILSDLSSALDGADELMNTLDRPEPQVEIEARIVQTSRDTARALGVQWGINGRMNSELGNTSPLAFPAQAAVSGRTGGTQNSPVGATRTDTPTGINLPVTGATSAIGLAMGTLNGALNLDVALSALEKTGNGKVLSSPRVMMQNNVEAEMMQGIQIPIQTVSNNTVTVTFKDAALQLKVKPQITASNTVIMDVNLENATPDYSREVNGIPPIDTQRAKTQVLVHDGDTTVIGGIVVSQETAAHDKVPVLHRVPLLGWLFKRDDVAETNRELLIFITPKIRR